MPRKKQLPINKTVVTFYRNVRGRIRRVNKRCHAELFADNRLKGELTPDHKQLHYHVKFPDYDTAVTYVVSRALGYAIEPPQFGHWIDSKYWTPLCITEYKGDAIVRQLEASYGKT